VVKRVCPGEGTPEGILLNSAIVSGSAKAAVDFSTQIRFPTGGDRVTSHGQLPRANKFINSVEKQQLALSTRT